MNPVKLSSAFAEAYVNVNINIILLVIMKTTIKVKDIDITEYGIALIVGNIVVTIIQLTVVRLLFQKLAKPK